MPYKRNTPRFFERIFVYVSRKGFAYERKQGGKPYATEQLQQLLDCLSGKFSLPLRCTVLIMTSSGCRVGFIQSIVPI